MGPGASNMASCESKMDHECSLEAFKHPKRAKQSTGKRPGAAKMGAKRLQDTPKSSQNCANIGSKWGLKLIQHGIRFRVLKHIDFSSNFRSIFYQKIKSKFDRFCKDLVIGLTISEKCNIHETL